MTEQKKKQTTADEVLISAFIAAVRSLGAKDFPMNADKLLSILSRYVPKGHSLDMKTTTYKKIGKFLQDMKKKGIIKIKEQKGVTQVLAIDASSVAMQELEDRVKELLLRETNCDDTSHPGLSSKGKVCIEIVYRLPPSLITVFNNDSVQTLENIEEMIKSWCSQQQLRTDDGVVVNETLWQLFFKKVPADQKRAVGDVVAFNDLFRRIEGKLQQYHRVSSAGKEPELRKGAPTTVIVTLEERQVCQEFGNRMFC